MNLLTKHRFAVPVNAEGVARAWRARGYSCDGFVDPPGREWNGFVHANNELVTVVEGLLQMTVGEVTWLVEPGDEVFIPRGAVHSVKNASTATTRWLFGYD